MIEVTDLTVGRSGRAVLAHLSFQLRPGAALRLVGPNGSGKTTLLRCLAGLAPPMSGDIAVDPETLIYAGHLDGVKPALTVAETLTFWGAVFGTGTTRLEAALSAFDLSALAARPAGLLSAGQKRRLGLARLIVANRPLWLLDEPTVALDTQAVAQFGTVVEAHVAAGGAALMATHIPLGLEAETLDIAPFKARPETQHQEDPFL